MTLFIPEKFTSHAGLTLPWKVDCDTLSDADWEVCAKLIGGYFNFGRVIGIPRGGLTLAKKLERFVKPGIITTLIVDDVFTTGKSMREERQRLLNEGVKLNCIDGVVVFARKPTPQWVRPIWLLNPWARP